MDAMDARDVVYDEYHRAVAHHTKSFNSMHEGYSVLLEEVDELWEQVKKNPKKWLDRDQRAREEAIQVAAMAIRFLVDCC